MVSCPVMALAIALLRPDARAAWRGRDLRSPSSHRDRSRGLSSSNEAAAAPGQTSQAELALRQSGLALLQWLARMGPMRMEFLQRFDGRRPAPVQNSAASLWAVCE